MPMSLIIYITINDKYNLFLLFPYFCTYFFNIINNSFLMNV